MPLSDDDPDKWYMRDHTKVKHNILEDYLVPWTRILGSTNRRVRYFDGFAGKGTYQNGEAGSPLIAMDVANRNSHNFDKFTCTFVEKNEENYSDLVREVQEKKKECSDKITVQHHNSSFGEVAQEIIDQNRNNVDPSFFFIDPFGYKGVPFDTVSEILNLRPSGVEVFLTFMVRDIRRFMEVPDREESISEIFGTDEWKKIADDDSIDDTEEELLKLYEEQLKEVAGVEYVWPFEMNLPDRSETVYYLIHATNHFKGFKKMKYAMYKQGAEDKFAYLGPDHYAYDGQQATLFESTGSEDTRVKELAQFLNNRFEGDQLKFGDIMRETYTETKLIEEHYRKAVKKLAREGEAEIQNFPDRENGQEYGVGADDEVSFNRVYASLESF